MELSPKQKLVYDALLLDEDVPIVSMFLSAYPNDLVDGITVRIMQQRLGSVIARANQKLTDERIVPGRLKQTYRLEKVEKDS